MKDVIKIKDRVLFDDYTNVREAFVMEISPSKEYVKLKYPYCGTVLERWTKWEVLLEILEKEQ